MDDPFLEDNLNRSRWTGLLWRPWKDDSVPKPGITGPSLLLIISVVLYSTGFVVVSTSLERLGVAMPAGDFLKIQYVYAGVFATAFVAFIFGASYLAFHMIETTLYGTVAPRKDIPRPSVVAMCMVAVGLYLQVAFAPPGSFSILAAIVLDVFILAWLGLSLYAQRPRKRVVALMPSLILPLILASLFLGVECVTVSRANWPGSAFAPPPKVISTIMITLPFLQSIYVGRLIFRLIKQERRTELAFGERFQWYFLHGAVVFMLYYATIVSFTVICYSSMPVRKGGADFTDAPAAILRLKVANSLPMRNALVDPLDQSGLASVPVVMLAETSSSYFVAPDPINQRSRWGKLGDARPPHVWEIPRDSVVGIDVSDRWPRPDPKLVNYIFAANTPCTPQLVPVPGQPTAIILRGTKAAVIHACSGHWLVWTEDGSIRAWVSTGLSLIESTK
jgi:hypothetical protein